MQYLLLIYEAEEIWESKSESERRALLAKHAQLHDYLTEQKVTFQGKPLMPTSTAVSVRTPDGAVSISDGPFAETKEQLAGFYLVDVDKLEQAIDIASRLGEGVWGTIEVRPVADHSEYME